MNEQVAYYVDLLRTSNSDDAYFSLIHADVSLVPHMIDAFRSEGDSRVRAILVEAIWQHRLPNSMEFLFEALHDEKNSVWQAALDGIVVIKDPRRIDLLVAELGRLREARHHQKDTHNRIAWIEEAVDQIKNEP